MPDAKAPSVTWNDEDDNHLLNFLLEKKRAGDSSENGFKKKVWTAAKEKLEGLGMENLKDSSCKSRWQRLRKQYVVVKAIKGKSGWPWSETRGAADVPHDVWIKFVEGMPDAKPFRSVGFPLYDVMAQLVEDTVADGRTVVHLGKKRQHEESDRELEDNNTGPITQSDDATDSGEEGAEDQPSASNPLMPLRLAKRIASSPAPKPKRARFTTQQAMVSVSDSITTLASAFAQDRLGSGTSGLAPTTPQRRTSAIQRLSQIDRNLSVRTRTTIIALFQDNIAAADTYMALDPTDTELHRAWMRKLLEEQHPGAIFKDLDMEEDVLL